MSNSTHEKGIVAHGLWTADRRVLDPFPLSWLNSCTRIPNFSVSSKTPTGSKSQHHMHNVMSFAQMFQYRPAGYAQKGLGDRQSRDRFKRPACGSFPSSSREDSTRAIFRTVARKSSTRAFLDFHHYHSPLDKALPDGSSGSARDDLQEIEFGRKMLNAAGELGF